jgi:hypothetical protein
LLIYHKILSAQSEGVGGFSEVHICT